MVAVPAAQAFPVPPSCSFTEAAAIPVAFLTAYHLLKALAPLRRGETVLVQAAAAGVGVSGLNIGGAPWNPGQHRAALEECLALVASGAVRPVVSAVFKMAQVAEAHDYLAQRRTMGKVILEP
jgi:NADPH:quinone reductase-like Zn-dependent oxidoreductase